MHLKEDHPDPPFRFKFVVTIVKGFKSKQEELIATWQTRFFNHEQKQVRPLTITYYLSVFAFVDSWVCIAVANKPPLIQSRTITFDFFRQTTAGSLRFFLSNLYHYCQWWLKLVGNNDNVIQLRLLSEHKLLC